MFIRLFCKITCTGVYTYLNARFSVEFSNILVSNIVEDDLYFSVPVRVALGVVAGDVIEVNFVWEVQQKSVVTGRLN